MLPGSDLVEENVVLGTDAGHLADLGHLVGVVDVVAEDGGGPRGGGTHSRQHVEQGGLA